MGGPMTRTSTAIRVATAVLAASALILGTAPADAQPSGATDKARWHGLATLNAKDFHVPPLLDVSANGHWVSASQEETSTHHVRDTVLLIRGDETGAVSRKRYPVGEVLAVRIDNRGNAIVLGFSRRGLVAVTWRHDQIWPRTHVFGVTGYSDVPEMEDNQAGDVVIHWPCGDRKQCVVRKPAGQPLERLLKVGRLRYDGATPADVALDGKGRLIGAFLLDHTVWLRTLAPDSRVFGAARKVLTNDTIEDWPHPATERATVSVGPRSDKVVTLGFGDLGADDERYGKVTILPSHGGRWDGEWSNGSFDAAVVGLSGRVTVPLRQEPGESQVIQWTPARRTFKTLRFQVLRASSPRGDLLLSQNAPSSDVSTPDLFSVRPDGSRALAAFRTVGWPGDASAIASNAVYVARTAGRISHYVLTEKTFRS